MRRRLVALALLGVAGVAWWWPSEAPETSSTTPVLPVGRREARSLEPVDAPVAVVDAPSQRATEAVREVPGMLRAGAPVADEAVAEPAPPARADVPGAFPEDGRAELLARAAARMTSPGLCEDEQKSRDALLDSFRRVEVADATVLIDPVLPEPVLARVASALHLARERSAELIAPGRHVGPPTIVVYRGLNQLRSVSCVNASAFGYYDGAIHLSGNPDGGLTQLEQTLVHEYAHHVLVQQRVRLPMWLSEGTAMLVAGETWWQQPELGLAAWLRAGHLPFDDLVPPFAHATDERTATHVYFQSLMMVEFVRRLRGMPAVTALIARLSQGLVSPDDAFAEATGLPPATLSAEFAAWVRRTLQ